MTDEAVAEESPAPDDVDDVDVDAGVEEIEELMDVIADIRDHMWCRRVDSAKRRLDDVPDTDCPVCEEFVGGLKGGVLFAISGHPDGVKERCDAVGDEAHRIYKLLEDVLEEQTPA